MALRARPRPRLLAIGLVTMLAASLAGLAAPAAGAPAALGRLWAASYNTHGNRSDTATALGVSPDGSTVFVAGSSSGFSPNDEYVVVAYEASTGVRLWVARHPGPSTYLPPTLAVSPDGAKVFVAGGNDGNGLTVAFDAVTGAQLWDARFRNGSAYGVGLSPDGQTVFVTGTIIGMGGDTDDYWTEAYDATTGARLWATRYADRGGLVDDAHALAVSPDGTTVFVTGYSQSDDFFSDYGTVAYDAATGAQLWVSRYNGTGSGYDNGSDLAVSPDGSTVWVTGNSPGVGSGNDYATVAYDSISGAQLWVSRYDDPLSSEDWATKVRITPDGSSVFVTGFSGGSVSYDYATVAYDSTTGHQRWVSRYNGPGDFADIPSDLAVSPDSATVFVTGASEGSGTASDYATVAYDAADGTQEGVSRIGTSNSDGAYAMGISADGSRLFVTGRVGLSSDDYGTFAFVIQ